MNEFKEIKIGCVIMFDRRQRGTYMYNFQCVSVDLLVLIEMNVFAIPYNMNANEFKTIVCIFPCVHEDASNLKDHCSTRF